MMLAKKAGVKHLIVLTNEMSDPTMNWSNERYEDEKSWLQSQNEHSLYALLRSD